MLPFAGSPQNSATTSRDCAECHRTIYETYQRTGMARSFTDARSQPRSGGSYYHSASQTWFTMIEHDGRYYQRRYQIGFRGAETNVDEKEINFFLGSGNHVRTFLSQTSNGALL